MASQLPLQQKFARSVFFFNECRRWHFFLHTDVSERLTLDQTLFSFQFNLTEKRWFVVIKRSEAWGRGRWFCVHVLKALHLRGRLTGAITDRGLCYKGKKWRATSTKSKLQIYYTINSKTVQDHTRLASEIKLYTDRQSISWLWKDRHCRKLHPWITRSRQG